MTLQTQVAAPHLEGLDGSEREAGASTFVCQRTRRGEEGEGRGGGTEGAERVGGHVTPPEATPLAAFFFFLSPGVEAPTRRNKSVLIAKWINGAADAQRSRQRDLG